jgi:hypothetical protein
VDRIVALLGEDKRDIVTGAMAEQDGTLRQFLALLVEEDERQRKNDEGIVITDTTCKR